MTNKEILDAVEEWVEENEYYVDEGYQGDSSVDTLNVYMVEAPSLITYLKKLLHE